MSLYAIRRPDGTIVQAAESKVEHAVAVAYSEMSQDEADAIWRDRRLATLRDRMEALGYSVIEVVVVEKKP